MKLATESSVHSVGMVSVLYGASQLLVWLEEKSVTDEQALEMYAKMEEYFGELPDPEHEPIRFAHCVKVYKYYNKPLDENPEVV